MIFIIQGSFSPRYFWRTKYSLPDSRLDLDRHI